MPFPLFLISTILIAPFVVSCAKPSETIPVTAPVIIGNGPVEQSVGEGPIQVRVYNQERLQDNLDSGRFQIVSSVTDKNGDSLVASFPSEFLGHSYLIGGVITTSSDKENEDMGGLKLSDLTPFHVRPELRDSGSFKRLALLGCEEKCEEGSDQNELFAIPVVAIDTKTKDIVLDLSRIGDDFNLFKRIDPDGTGLELKTQSIRTIAVDSSLATLIFDNEVSMIPLNAAPNAKATLFTVRWYLKLASSFSASFEPRVATQGVGYFMTERAKTPKVQRHALSPLTNALANGPVHYFIKNVPLVHQRSFASAFDEWNGVFVKVTGKKLLSYEFVSPTDPRHALLVAGDPRYHIVEWDLVNAAPYGGLGPSQAHQHTGEIFGSNILIQGPKIIKIYTEWFESVKKMRELQAEGLFQEASEVAQAVSLRLNRLLEVPKSTLSVSLTDGKTFTIHSQNPPLQDPIMQREDFDIFPTNYDFQQYMDGYFHDMMAHELGHNLGLRHNFKGNLFSELPLAVGKVSISIMEYLGRGFRYLDRIGVYDVMAIEYGYLGKDPAIKNRFCTDEHVPNPKEVTLSAECSRDDATPDPFKFLTDRLTRATDLLLARGSQKAPVWSLDDMKREVTAVLPAIGYYVTSAATAGSGWQVFFTGGDRPSTTEEVPAYVTAKLKSILCPADFEIILNSKNTETAKAKTKENRDALVKRAIQLLSPLKVLSESDTCH